MLILYTTREDAAGRELQQALQDAGLAHEVVLVADDSPPTLVDEGRAVRGERDILARLSELVAVRDEWHKYGSDACYCDANGEIE